MGLNDETKRLRRLARLRKLSARCDRMRDRLFRLAADVEKAGLEGVDAFNPDELLTMVEAEIMRLT